MKISLWSVGKSHELYIEDGVATFTNRISHYYPVEWKIFASPAYGTLNEDQIRKAEAAPILSSLKSKDVLITLDEKGKQWTSMELADFIQQKANESSKNLIFLIGGAYGIHESVVKQSFLKWSLSTLVFPHQLVRLILAEQIYRACTIIRNEKYHHS
ncbi:MAG: 23S rRNA (pseudouridine(1915)-N(3))-methyltransferase RlmH [Ginsengibacter sp.]